jgi:hypothetical protein
MLALPKIIKALSVRLSDRPSLSKGKPSVSWRAPAVVGKYRLKFFLEIIGHVFMCGHGGLAFNYSRGI